MADNDQNDEYKFDEYDSLEGDSESPKFGSEEQKPQSIESQPPNDFKRNAIIAVCVIVAIMLGYKLIGGLFSRGDTNAIKGTIPPAPTSTPGPAQPQVQSQFPPRSQPIPEATPQHTPPPVVSEDNSALIQKVNTIETNQQNLQTQVSATNEQITTINNNVNNLTVQINRLNQAITDLTNQLSKQSEEISLLMERTKPKRIRRIIRSPVLRELNIYYINAVIPGRAWLIGVNGSTLTVREGTKIPGYGVVRLIDSMEGRILTSSGRVIKFSQEDS